MGAEAVPVGVAVAVAVDWGAGRADSSLHDPSAQNRTQAVIARMGGCAVIAIVNCYSLLFRTYCLSSSCEIIHHLLRVANGLVKK